MPMPMPTPTTTMFRIAVASLVVSDMRLSRYIPTTSTMPPATTSSRYLPIRDTSSPASVLETTMPSIIGVVTTPELVADAPRTPCTNIGMKVIAPNMPIPMRNVTPLATTKTRLRKSSGGMIGSSARLSVCTKAMAPSAASVSSATIWGESQA